jgi:hypothetical protein
VERNVHFACKAEQSSRIITFSEQCIPPDLGVEIEIYLFFKNMIFPFELFEADGVYP